MNEEVGKMEEQRDLVVVLLYFVFFLFALIFFSNFCLGGTAVWKEGYGRTKW